jgi:hypothetical protein
MPLLLGALCFLLQHALIDWQSMYTMQPLLQVVHDHRLSPASDIYSFGVLMWALWACELPYVIRGSTARNVQSIHEKLHALPGAADFRGSRWQYVCNPLYPGFRPCSTPPSPYLELMKRYAQSVLLLISINCFG